MRYITTTVRRLRKNATPAETKLWEELRKFRKSGYSFRRQHPVGKVVNGNTTRFYVADFCCVSLKLIIELDGEIHASQQEEDLTRQQILENFGYKVLRFSNAEVDHDLEKVLRTIESHLQQ